MGRSLKHILIAPDGGVIHPHHLSIIRFGKCMRSPYVEDALWFVMVPPGDSSMHLAELRGPEAEHTFLVEEAYAYPAAINQRRRDITKWREVARQVFLGAWCEHFECLWHDVPVYNHTLPNGSVVKFGYCRSQSLEYPERELWFVSFRDALFMDHPSTFVVDALCTNRQFLDRMGNDQWKWMTVCWCRLDEGNEVRWDDLKTGTLEGGWVRSHDQFVDSPYLPFRTEEIIPRITMFEDEVSANRRSYNTQHQGLLSRRKQWKNLTEVEQVQLEQRWRQQACDKIRGRNALSHSGLP